MPYSQCTQTWITQFYLQITPCLPFLCKHSQDGATPNWGSRHAIVAYYSLIDPEGMKGWVDLVGWYIADSLPINGLANPRLPWKQMLRESDCLTRLSMDTFGWCFRSCEVSWFEWRSLLTFAGSTLAMYIVQEMFGLRWTALWSKGIQQQSGAKNGPLATVELKMCHCSLVHP